MVNIMETTGFLFEGSLKDLGEIARKALAACGSVKVWLFEGELGAGKTTWIKTLCTELGVEGGMSSPSYSIVNHYETSNKKNIYHLDCYRLKNESEAIEIGVEDYFYSGDFCFVEWPSKIQGLWPQKHVKVSVSLSDKEEHRFFKLSIEHG